MRVVLKCPVYYGSDEHTDPLIRVSSPLWEQPFRPSTMSFPSGRDHGTQAKPGQAKLHGRIQTLLRCGDIGIFRASFLKRS